MCRLLYIMIIEMFMVSSIWKLISSTCIITQNVKPLHFDLCLANTVNILYILYRQQISGFRQIYLFLYLFTNIWIISWNLKLFLLIKFDNGWIMLNVQTNWNHRSTKICPNFLFSTSDNSFTPVALTLTNLTK